MHVPPTFDTTTAMGSKPKKELAHIGWREWISLPDLGVKKIKAKIDTGARSSSLHAHDIHPFRRRGKDMVRFEIHPMQRENRTSLTAEAEVIDERRVKSSSGVSELRPVILTTIELLDRSFEVEVNLTNRDVMGFRMLLGRQALRGSFLVDPSRSYYDEERSPRRQKRTRFKESE